MFFDVIDRKMVTREFPIQNVAEIMGVNFLSIPTDTTRYAICPKCRCKSKDNIYRCLIISTTEQTFYCTASGAAGCVINFVAHVKDMTLAEALVYLLGASSNISLKKLCIRSDDEITGNALAKLTDENIFPGDQIDSRLVKLRELGILQETALHFGAGYCNTGHFEGRIVVPLSNLSSSIVGYWGFHPIPCAPLNLFIGGKDNYCHPLKLFNMQNVAYEDDLYLVDNPLQVMKAHQVGLTSVVCFIGAGITIFPVEQRYIIERFAHLRRSKSIKTLT